MRICYFGAFDLSYTRNSYVRRCLELNNCSIFFCNVPQHWPTYKKVLPLIVQFCRFRNSCDIIIVAEFCQTVVPLAWLLGKITGKLIVFDMVIGLYEASVLERCRYPENSISAKKLHLIDQMAIWFSDLVITGTEAYRNYLIDEFHGATEKIQVVPLGVDDSLFFPKTRNKINDRFVVLYHGSFIPNHGLNIIVKCASLLNEDKRFIFRLVGDGEQKEDIQLLSNKMKLNNIEFVSKVPFKELPKLLVGADIVLGVFGNTSQARKAMANKILEGLAMKKTVVSGDTDSIRENFVHKQHIWLVPLGDAKSLSKALCGLVENHELMENLAESGYNRVKQRLTPRVVGANLIVALENAYTIS